MSQAINNLRATERPWYVLGHSMNREPIQVTVATDEFTAAASRAFDLAFDGTSKFQPWSRPTELPQDFRIGLIVGPSGSGKSILLKEFGQEDPVLWSPSKAIVSQFPTPEEAINRLMAVGLNTIPSWLKPYHVLSTGERFRADLARRLHDFSVIDEFTSTVDRNVAKATCRAVRRFIRNDKLTGVVFASCHFDILDWLEPDWYFDTSDGTLYDGRCLRRPEIQIRLYPSSPAAWPMFAPHHYLSGKLNPTARCYLSTADFGASEVVTGFVSSLSFPCGTLKNARREHRTVVLPDYQGLGIGPVISDAVAQIEVEQGFRYFSKTAHPRFGMHRERSPLWKPTSKNNRSRRDYQSHEAKHGLWKGWEMKGERLCFSHEYIAAKK
jgi:hypothetical protein